MIKFFAFKKRKKNNRTSIVTKLFYLDSALYRYFKNLQHFSSLKKCSNFLVIIFHNLYYLSLFCCVIFYCITILLSRSIYCSNILALVVFIPKKIKNPNVPVLDNLLDELKFSLVTILFCFSIVCQIFSYCFVYFCLFLFKYWVLVVLPVCLYDVLQIT